MTDLPEGWEWTRLEELLAAQPRAITDGPFGSNLKSAHYVESGPRVIRLQNIGFGQFVDARAHIAQEHFETLRAHEVVGGDLVLASLGEDLPRACIIPNAVGPAIVKADCIRVRLHPGIDSRYVNYAMQRPALRGAVRDQVHGVGRPRLGMGGIRELAIPLPPLAEQERIVVAIEEHLSRLDAAETSLSSASKRLELHDRASKASLMESSGWEWTTLGEIAELKGGVTKDAQKESDPTFVSVPYLRVANVQRGYLDLSEVTYIRVDPKRAESLCLRPGDVLFNEGGDRDKLGRGWVWEGQIDQCVHQNHVFRARITSPDFDSYFLSTHANTWGQAWFEKHGRQTTNLASISLTTLKQLPVPAPSLAAQRQIVTQLLAAGSGRGRLSASVEAARRRAETLRRSTLAAAFSGHLVPQDPADEPASVLLQRIRAERDTRQRGSRARKVTS